jgi:hypothetical protein
MPIGIDISTELDTSPGLLRQNILRPGRGKGFRRGPILLSEGAAPAGPPKIAESAKGVGEIALPIGLYTGTPWIIAASITLQVLGAFASIWGQKEIQPRLTEQEKIARERYDRATRIRTKTQNTSLARSQVEGAVRMIDERRVGFGQRQVRSRIAKSASAGSDEARATQQANIVAGDAASDIRRAESNTARDRLLARGSVE